VKIAVIEPSGRLYGSEYCLLDIIDGLPKDRFSWRIVLPKGRGLDRLLLDRGIDCEFLVPSYPGSLSQGKKMGAYAKIIWRLKQIKPDLLYVNQAGSLRAAAIYARLLKLPVVCQVQTLEDARWLNGFPKPHDVVNAFVCNSQFIAAELYCDPHKKCVLYQGIAEERVIRALQHLQERRGAQRENKEEKGVAIGILGRIAISKGHYLFLEAASLLKDWLPTCRFVVIGEGLTAEDTLQFSEAVQESGLDADFELRGYRTDLTAELSRLDLLVIPSLAEPLGRVLFDAAEHGVPVVLSDAGGLGELARRFNIGVTFKSGDSEALADAIVMSVDDYPAICLQFYAAAVSMLERLPMRSYLDSVDRILRAAAYHKTANEVWLGDA
jgi:glycosyltransferase involved in cell wall biosynthesis